MPTNTLRIWSHVRQIAPLSKDQNGDAWFSLNLTPVFVSDAGASHAVTDGLARQYLLPWTWQWTNLSVALIAKGRIIGGVNIAQQDILSEAPLPELTGGGSPGPDGVFNEEFEQTVESFNEESFTEGATDDPASPVTMTEDTPRNWRSWLFHASTYPGDIPLRAGLAAWFRVPYQALAGADEIAVAPLFDGAPFSGPLAPRKLPATAGSPPDPCDDLTHPGAANCPLIRFKTNLQPFLATDNDWVTKWIYDTPAAGDLKAEWIQPRTPLRIPGTNSWSTWGNDGFIDESTLWITPPNGSPGGNGWGQGADWHEQLEQRLASLFDLPLRLLEWADQTLLNGSPPPAVDPNIGMAILATMRDLMCTIVGDNSGNLVRPDGGTLAQDIAVALAPSGGSPDVQQRIVDQIADHYKQFATYSNWRAHLQAALDASKNFADLTGGWETPPANGPYNDWLNKMHRVRGWLFDPANLQVFIKADIANAVPTYLQGDGSAAVDQFFANIDLLTALRLGFMGPAWRAQQGGWYDRSVIAENMAAALKHVYRDRLSLPDISSPPAPQPDFWTYSTLQPRVDHATASQQKSIEDYLDSFIKTWNESQSGPNPAPGSTPDFSRGNQGITLQFSSYNTRSENGRITDEESYLGGFRGAAGLIRKTGTDSSGKQNPWSVLHIGQYSLRGEIDPAAQIAPAFDLERVAVAPVQIVYRNGLRQVTDTYRNNPLSARSPAAALSQVRSFKGAIDNSDGYADYRTGLFQLWSPYRSGSPYRLWRLVFGLQYDVAATAVGLAGEMAAEVGDSTRPWRVRSDITALTVPVGKFVTTPPYLRTVPVGLIRVEGGTSRAGKAISNLNGTPIPDGVYPIIRSLKPVEGSSVSSPPGSNAALFEQKHTVFLLCDTGNVAGVSSPGSWISAAVPSVQFFIRPPATDLATFDSWPLSASLEDRATIYSLIAQHTDIKNDQDSSSAPDLTLDDPAVTGFSVTLTQIYPALGSPSPFPPPGTFAVRRPAGSSTKLLQQYQSPHVPVTITVGASANVDVPKQAADPYAVNVTLPPRTVCRLDISPVVDDSNLFSIGACQPAPRSFYIEVAAPLNVQDLNQAATGLNDALTPSVAGETMQVRFDLAKLSSETSPADLAPQLHRVELLIQRWRWQGRPLYREDADGQAIYNFPFDELSTSDAIDDVLEPLDGVYFGERDSNDQLVDTSQVDAISDSSVVGSPPTLPLLYSYDLSSSPQALYYRFAVRVYSRYEKLFTNGAYVESRFRTGKGSNGSELPELWRRIVPLCRRNQAAPKPAVRLIIPLTQTASEGGQLTPGLMVVLNEAWFDWAGLAEQFEVQIPSVTAPDGTIWQQAGADPVIGNADFTVPGVPPPVRLESSPEPVGPAGFTFDTNTNAPLFPYTSFVVPAPRQQNDDGTFQPIELAWYLLQLKFRRTLQPLGTEQFTDSLNSDWTDPVQAQLLPAANLWHSDASLVDVKDLLAAFASGSGITLTDSAGTTVNLDANTPGATNRFELWVLLTASLKDAFGHSGQEAFLTLIPYGTLGTWPGLPGQPATALRLVEVQAMTFTPSRDEWRGLADDMFSQSGMGPDPEMARARIVRVSPPIAISV